MEFLRNTMSCLKGIKQCSNPNSNDTTISYEQTPSFTPVKAKSAQSCHHTGIDHSKDRFQIDSLNEFPLLVVTPEKPKAIGLTSTFIHFESSAVLSNDLTQISPELSRCQHFEINEDEDLDVSECDVVAFSNECYNSPATNVTNAFANKLYDSPEIKQAKRQINFDDLTYVSVDMGLSSTDFHSVNPSFFNQTIQEIFV